MDIPEHIRANIDKMIHEALAEAKPNVKASPELMHMITSISYVMHRAGIKDTFRSLRSTLDELERRMTQ